MARFLLVTVVWWLVSTQGLAGDTFGNGDDNNADRDPLLTLCEIAAQDPKLRPFNPQEFLEICVPLLSENEPKP